MRRHSGGDDVEENRTALGWADDAMRQSLGKRKRIGDHAGTRRESRKEIAGHATERPRDEEEKNNRASGEIGREGVTQPDVARATRKHYPEFRHHPEEWGEFIPDRAGAPARRRDDNATVPSPEIDNNVTRPDACKVQRRLHRTPRGGNIRRAAPRGVCRQRSSGKKEHADPPPQEREASQSHQVPGTGPRVAHTRDAVVSNENDELRGSTLETAYLHFFRQQGVGLWNADHEDPVLETRLGLVGNNVDGENDGP